MKAFGLATRVEVSNVKAGLEIKPGASIRSFRIWGTGPVSVSSWRFRDTENLLDHFKLVPVGLKSRELDCERAVGSTPKPLNKKLAPLKKTLHVLIYSRSSIKRGSFLICLFLFLVGISYFC